MTDLSKIGDFTGMAVDHTDRIAGEGPRTLESGVYPAKIDLAFLQKSGGGALMMHVHYKTDTAMVKQRFVLTSGDAKGNRNYFTDQEGNQRPLPDLLRAENLAQLACGKGFGQLSTAEKTVKLWSYEEQSEVPTKKEVVMDLLGKQVQIGVLKVSQNKRAQENGNWVDTADKQEVNEVDKLFGADGKTLTEAQAKEPGTFIDTWKKKFENKVIDKYKPVAGKAPTVGAGPGPSQPSTTAPLFED